jgi:hypothetical protein
MPNVPPDNSNWLDVDSVNQQGILKGIITLTSDGKEYMAACSFPSGSSLKEGDKLRIMYRGQTAVLAQRIINGKLEEVKFQLVFG